jgi:hypothetical protein
MANIEYQSFKLYHVRHCAGEGHSIGAESADEACEKLGWIPGNCRVRLIFDPADYDDPTFQAYLQGRGSLDN